METKLYVLNNFISTGIIDESEDRLIREASRIIAAGGLCAFPTETVYGLGGNALMKEASRHIYEAKGRPSDNPLIVHISCMGELYPLVKCVSDAARRLADAFWPGPMTLIFDKSELVPRETTGGLDTIAVRMPSHPVASRLIKYAGVPVAAPSANISGRPSTTSGSHCMEDLDGRVDAVIDAGSADIGLESTIVDLTGERPMLLRPGAVSREMIEGVLGVSVGLDAALKGPLADGIAPKAPGMKYRHYAPKAPMTLVTVAPKGEIAGGDAPRTELERIAEKIAELIREKKGQRGRMALFCSSECSDLLKAGNVPLEGIDIKISGSRDQENGLKGIAHGLFDNLREFDADSVDYIIAEGYSERELGTAVMNRLKKAAAWHIIYV